MSPYQNFSSRFGYSAPFPDVSVRESAPPNLRHAILHFAVRAGLKPQLARAILLDLLCQVPHPELWTSDSNVLRECLSLLESAEWFEVYDFAELAARQLLHLGPQGSRTFESQLNRYFERNGIGWRLEEDCLNSRGSEAFQYALISAREALQSNYLPTSRNEIHEALADLSRRPNPDLTGAIQHAAAALECVAREVAGDPKATLGEILTRNKTMLPAPLSQAAEKIWGYSSEMARHIREGRTPSREDAELAVGLFAVVAAFLAKKVGQS